MTAAVGSGGGQGSGGNGPQVASVNCGMGVTRGNLVTVKLGVNGKVCAYTFQDVHVVVDVQGVYLTS